MWLIESFRAQCEAYKFIFPEKLTNEITDIFSSIANSLISIFVKTEVFSSYTEKCKTKGIIWILFSKKFEPLLLTVQHLPMVSKPIKWSNDSKRGGLLLNRSGVVALIRTLYSGQSDAELTDRILFPINLVQSKSYSVNSIVLNLLKKIAGERQSAMLEPNIFLSEFNLLDKYQFQKLITEIETFEKTNKANFEKYSLLMNEYKTEAKQIKALYASKDQFLLERLSQKTITEYLREIYALKYEQQLLSFSEM